jgi:hypothetical protein
MAAHLSPMAAGIQEKIAKILTKIFFIKATLSRD